MASKKQLMDNVKNIGWTVVSLTASKGFKGAVQNYSSTSAKAVNGQVAVAFNMHEAFIVADADGLFTADDINAGIIKDKAFDIEERSSIDGATVLAWEENGTVSFDEEELEALGLNDFEVKDSLRVRLLNLSALDILEDVQV